MVLVGPQPEAMVAAEEAGVVVSQAPPAQEAVEAAATPEAVTAVPDATVRRHPEARQGAAMAVAPTREEAVVAEVESWAVQPEAPAVEAPADVRSVAVGAAERAAQPAGAVVEEAQADAPRAAAVVVEAERAAPPEEVAVGAAEAWVDVPPAAEEVAVPQLAAVPADAEVAVALRREAAVVPALHRAAVPSAAASRPSSADRAAGSARR